MADNDTEVIKRQMEETRLSLAQKIENLSDQVSQTVQEATEAVSGTVETVKEAVSDTREAVHETVQSVKRSLDLASHVQEYPWLMMGGAVAVGFAAGRLIPSLATPSPRRELAAKLSSNGQITERAIPPRREEEAGPSRLHSALASEVGKLKPLAVSLLLGLIREKIIRPLDPPLSNSLAELVDEVTVNLGGTPMKWPETSSPGHSVSDRDGRQVASEQVSAAWQE